MLNFSEQELDNLVPMVQKYITEFGFTTLAGKGHVEGQLFSYLYTVGLTEQGLPEVIITAEVPDFLVLRLIKEVIEAIKRRQEQQNFNQGESEVFNLGDFTTTLNDYMTEPTRFKFVLIDPRSSQTVLNDFMPMVKRCYDVCGQEDYYVIQLLVANEYNKLPGESGYNATQPVLLQA